MFYIGLYTEKHEKIFLSETTRPRAMIFGMKHYLVVFYPVLKLYPWSQKWQIAIFLYETIRPRAMIFGIWHHLVDNVPWAKNGLALGVTYFTLAYKGKNIEKSSCLKP